MVFAFTFKVWERKRGRVLMIISLEMSVKKLVKPTVQTFLWRGSLFMIASRRGEYSMER
ncbi:MAG: hypothetical protein BWY86_01277 [Candidatus Aminicenantes bacterium ADurb.Bin508]|nr:MAG: hypothetical protein BWY86_01277 [Candidatus Aminicenantes bacterium ADurb.Bin508]